MLKTFPPALASTSIPSRRHNTGVTSLLKTFIYCFYAVRVTVPADLRKRCSIGEDRVQQVNISTCKLFFRLHTLEISLITSYVIRFEINL